MGVSLEQSVRRLQDRVELEELMARYCRQADSLNAEGMAECFVPDCIVAYVPASMAGARSRQERLGFFREQRL